MAPYIPPPNTDTLLPPLLACLPTAFVSPRPPPALLPLLSPVLRQRVKLLSDTNSSSESSWLPLLCWESTNASELVALVENASFEPHPVSGEVELGDIDRIQYRRLDQETLQSMAKLLDIGLGVTFLWCEGDQEGGGTGWRVSEVGPLKGTGINSSYAWWNTISEADEKSESTFLDIPERHISRPSSNGVISQGVDDNNDDDDYWARYDQTPSRTPAPDRSSARHAVYSQQTNGGLNSETNYFARYSQVQPALDSDDPSANKDEIGHSSLNGNSLLIDSQSPVQNLKDQSLSSYQDEIEFSAPQDIVHTRASSSDSSAIIAQLEDSAESQSHAEIAIQHHISTSIKNLYRLARGVGIENLEFQRLVQTELETLSMLDDE